MSGLPESLLLDAAHIVADKDEHFSQPIVPNGIPLSKIHHAAFDAHLIGIDPDYGLHVSERLLIQHDGPMLEALKHLNGGTIHVPTRVQDRPDRDRLALRYERFKAAVGAGRNARLPITNQKFRDSVPHETKAYAIAKSAQAPRKQTQKQPLKKTVPNLRSQEVSREMAVKSADMTFVG